MTKAVALLSGGLTAPRGKDDDRTGHRGPCPNFTSAFCTCNHGGKDGGGCRSESNRSPRSSGSRKVLAKGDDYIDIVRNPKHGYGKGA